MGIIWLIIKIILIILLILIALLVTIITVMLVAPIQYEAYAARYDEVTYDIRIRYLMGIQGLFIQEDDKKNHVIKVFGKVVYKNKIAEEEGVSAEEQVPSKEDISAKEITTPKENVTQSNEEVTEQEKQQSLEKDKQENEQVKKPLEEEKHDTIKVDEDKEKQISVKEAVKQETVKQDKNGQDLEVIKEVNPQLKEEAKEGIKDVAEEIKEETEETIENMSPSWLKKFLLDKTTYESLKQIVRYTWYILKYISPYEWDFEVVIGKENPADTGEMIAKLSAFYALYGNHGIIRGNYQKACLEGGFLVKGKFKIGGILMYILRCILSKSVRKTIYLIYQLRKDEKKHGN